MQPEGMNYRAVRDIPVVAGDAGAAIAYRAGQLVHESAVEGPDAWLSLGADVEPVAGAVLTIPPRNASQAIWAAFMTSRGMDADEAQASSRAQLVAAFDASGEGGPPPSGGSSDGNADQAAD